MKDLQLQIEEILRGADLSMDERQRIDSVFAGRKLTSQTIDELQHFIKMMHDERQRLSTDWGSVTMTSNERIDMADYKIGTEKSKVQPKYELTPYNGYAHQSDNVPMCSHCHSTGNTKFLGTISLDGMEQPAYSCGNCNKVFSKLPNSIKALADEAVKQGAKSFSFTPSVAADQVTQSYVNQNTSPNYAEQQMANNTQQMANDMASMLSAIRTLTEQVRVVAEKNNELMEKLSRDPLASVRKGILDFNLQ